jgi:hypothetical protein
MKTTVEIPDALLERARRQARRSGRPVRALIEEGLRRVLDADAAGEHFRLPDRSVGEPGAEDPLAALDWRELRAEIYGGR